METDTNSGVYQGKVTVKITQAPNNTIRRDDIRQILRVNSAGDTIIIVANVDTTKRDTVGYRVPHIPPTGICESHSPISALVFSKLAPNPFTGAAFLRYTLGSDALVSVKVYDISGNLMDMLINKVQPANSYTIKWDSSKFSQGVYFIRMEVGKFTKMHKVVKIK